MAGNAMGSDSPWASPREDDDDFGAAPAYASPADGPSSAPPASGWGAPPSSGWGAPPPPVAASAPPRNNAAGPDAYARFKPGIITLRPLSFGQLLDGGIKALRHNPKVMLGLNGIVSLVATLALFGFGFTYFSEVLTIDDTSEELPFSVGGIVAFVVGSFVSSLLLTMVTALSSVSVGRSVIGVKIPPGEAWSAAMKRMPSVVGVTLLMSGVAIVGYFVVILIVVLAAAVSPGLAIALGILLALGTIALAAWAGIKLSLTLPAAVLERLGPIAAMRRSWRLTTGRFWMIFSVLLVASLITSAIQNVMTAPVSFVLPLLAYNSPEVSTSLFVALLAAASYIGILLSTVFLASVTAVVYTDQRMRREGFDLILAQAAQRTHGA